MANDQLIYGLRPILQAVQDGQTIDKVFLQKGISGALYTQLEGTLRDAGIEPKYVPVEKLNRVTRGNHQGAVAYLSPIDFHDLEEVIMKVMEEGGWRMVTELVVGMLMGLGIGYGLDHLLGTLPLFLIIFIMLGFAAGVRTMMRTAEEVQRKNITVDDDELSTKNTGKSDD